MSDRLGLPHLHETTIDSTNARARELAIAGAPHGAMVSADVQTAGRGRQGRDWVSPAGVMAQSFVLRMPLARATLLPMIAAVAVAETCGSQTQIKWPNDVWLRRPAPGELPRKVAGILIETRQPSASSDSWFVLGIGVNAAVDVNALQPDVRARAGSLGLTAADLPALRATLVDELERALELETDALLAAWQRRDALVGREIAWNGGRGTADGITAAGALRVARADGGVDELIAGEVHLEPIAAG